MVGEDDARILVTLEEGNSRGGSSKQKPHAMKLKSAALVVATFAIANFTRAQVFEWSSSGGGNGHFYEPVLTGGGNITWDNAKLAAEAKGGYLATLTTAAENNFVFSLIDSGAYWQREYIGGADITLNKGPMFGGFQPDGSIEPAGGWQWLNGDGTFDATFTSWQPGQPNNIFGGQQVIWFYTESAGNVATPPRAATWDDLHAGVGAPSYVIEYNVNPVPEPAETAAVVGLGLGAFAWLRRNRKASAH